MGEIGGNPRGTQAGRVDRCMVIIELAEFKVNYDTSCMYSHFFVQSHVDQLRRSVSILRETSNQ